MLAKAQVFSNTVEKEERGVHRSSLRCTLIAIRLNMLVGLTTLQTRLRPLCDSRICLSALLFATLAKSSLATVSASSWLGNSGCGSTPSFFSPMFLLLLILFQPLMVSLETVPASLWDVEYGLEHLPFPASGNPKLLAPTLSYAGLDYRLLTAQVLSPPLCVIYR